MIHHEDETHILKLQMFDKDIFSSDEMIGSAELDFTDPADFSYAENMRQITRIAQDEDDELKQKLLRVK